MPCLVRSVCALALNGLVASLALAGGPSVSTATGARPAATASDATPPVVTSFSLPSAITLAQLGQYMPFTVKARDGGVGLNQVSALLTSPSGNQQIELWVSSYGETRMDRRTGTYLAPNMEPGIWQIQRVSSCDLATNCNEWTGTALASIKGRHQVEIRSAYYDITPPNLASGVLGLTWVDGTRGLVAATVTAQDTGNPRAAGVWSAQIELCRDEPQGGYCLSMNGSTGLPDLATAEVRAGTWVDIGYTPPGVYHLKSVVLSDFNGVTHRYTSTLFGGETDFTSLFNTTTVSL